MQAAREINAAYSVIAHPISPSTLSGMRSRRSVEGDGVLQMLRWLGRTPESFVPEPDGSSARTVLPDVGPDRILRFETKTTFARLDAQRVERGLTGVQVAAEIGGGQPASLKRLRQADARASPR